MAKAPRYTNPARKVIAAGKRRAAAISLTTKCLGCGHGYTEQLPWFQRHDFKCPACGGTLDSEPLRQMMIAATDDILRRLKSSQRIQGRE
jgi:hypothetical protein